MAWLIVLLGAGLGAVSVGGQVVDGAGAPVPQAQVFLEPGLGANVLHTTSDAEGRFYFESLAPGPTGVFAIAPGFAWAGVHHNLSVSESAQNIRLVLRPAAHITGRAVDPKGKPVEGARITRIALLDDSKVGIPLAKLGDFGVEEPVSNAEGRFRVPNLPAGGTVALKIAHGAYAQEGVDAVAAGAEDLKVTLHPGMTVQGTVVSRERGLPVTNAAVIIRNAQPPHDSTIASTDNRGAFAVRLKPGVYMYQAIGSGLRSAGWEQLTLTGERAMPRIQVMVAGAGSILGKVRDAVSGDPVAGARVALETYGNAAAIVETGPSGEFRVEAGAGDTLVRLEGAPGFSLPHDTAVRLTIEEGQQVELPDWFLVPLPTFHLQVIDSQGEPAAGAAVSIVRPRQFGSYTADAEGKVAFQVHSLPPDGRVIGTAEDPSEPFGAVFSLERADAAGARVQLMRFASVSGQVVNGRGKGVEGIVVGGIFPGEEADQELLLWRTVTDGTGTFRWPAVAPGIPQRCVAIAGGESTAQSPVFSLEPAGVRQLENMLIENAESADSLLGERLPVDEYSLVCGAKPAEGETALYTFSPPAQAAASAEGLARVQAQAGAACALVVPGGFDCASAQVPVLRGVAPGRATSYVTNSEGVVILETFDIPPLYLLNASAGPAK